MSDPANLQNLHTIVLPPEVGLLPPAPGWYLLTLIGVLFCSFTFYKLLQKKKKKLYRRKALEQLNILKSSLHTAAHADPKKEQLLRQLPMLVKNTALTVFPRTEVADLHGNLWLEFLDSSLDTDANNFEKGAGKILPQLSFGTPEQLLAIQTVEINQLIALIEHWIKNHQILCTKKVNSND